MDMTKKVGENGRVSGNLLIQLNVGNTNWPAKCVHTVTTLGDQFRAARYFGSADAAKE